MPSVTKRVVRHVRCEEKICLVKIKLTVPVRMLGQTVTLTCPSCAAKYKVEIPRENKEEKPALGKDFLRDFDDLLKGFGKTRQS